MNMRLIERDQIEHEGYGAGWGEIITEVYECPCGKGQVISTKDDIPGFRDRDTSCKCPECFDKYDFDRNIAKIK
ncbi:hypothetical protein HB943_02150 [Listeria weihenstephanensis]|uniref:Uncharacterized protein n=1 Tax=Listeria weihenstephanensis TaxID=1006155 RepID=A0A841Z394_9LIST|nr:hypothetical protein [Listeria weihenstephanensis]